MKFRVCHIPQIPRPMFIVEVEDLKSAKLMQKTLCDYDLFQFDNKIKPDYSNASFIQCFCDEYNDWEDLTEDEEDNEIID